MKETSKEQAQSNGKSESKGEMTYPSHTNNCPYCNKPVQATSSIPVPFRPQEEYLVQQETDKAQEDIVDKPKTSASKEPNAKQDPPRESAEQQPANKQNETAAAPMDVPEQLPVQEAFFENIMRLNQGKKVDVHMNFDGSAMTREVFTGRILAGGRDNIVLQNVETGENFVLLTVFLNYVVFHEDINFNPDLAFGSGSGLVVTPS